MPYLPSSDSLIQVILAPPEPEVPTTLVLTSSANPADYGMDLTYTAVLSAADNTAPTGTVQFYIDGASFGPPVALSTTTVTVDVPGNALSVGNHLVEARYIP
jgi:hypothetical protein